MTFPGVPDSLPRMPVTAYAHDAEPQPSSVRAKVVLVVACAVAGVLLALLAGWAWVVLARPPSAVLTQDGVLFGEPELDRKVGVTLWFLVVTAAFGVISGLVVAWRGYRHGLVVVLAILVMSVVGSLLTFRFGQDLFGADPQAQLKTAKLGDTITDEVGLGTKIVYLGWPVGGMVGAMAGIFGWPKRQIPPTMPPLSSNLGPQSSS